jgi:hypothetical protein
MSDIVVVTVVVMTRWADRRGHPPRLVAGSLEACRKLPGPRDRALSEYLRFLFCDFRLPI